jgi:hypothetical protein
MWFEMKNEWRVPLSLIICSSMIFTAVTFAFGFRINRITGDFEISNDSWNYDPMEIVWGTHWRYYSMVGFYATLGIFVVCWFDWMKHRCPFESICSRRKQPLINNKETKR